MSICRSMRFQFEGVNADPCEKLSNCLLAPLRIGFGYRKWDEEKHALTTKVASICMAIFAFTIWLVPTLIGLILWKFSKTHPQHHQAMQSISTLLPKASIPAKKVLPPDPLEKAELGYKNIHAVSSAEITSMGVDLEAAYTKTLADLKVDEKSYNKPLMLKLSRIFFLEAKRLQEDCDPFTSENKNNKRILALYQGALDLQTTGLSFELFNAKLFGVFSLNSSLEELSKGSHFEILEHYLDRHLIVDHTRRIRKAYPNQIFEIAMILKELAVRYSETLKYSYDHIHTYFTVAKELFEYLDTPDSRWEIGMINYYHGAYVHLHYNALKNFPYDIPGFFKVLDEMKPFIDEEKGSLRAKLMHILLLVNKCSLDKTRSSVEKFKALSEVFDLMEQIPGYNIYFKMKFLSLKARFALECLNNGLITFKGGASLSEIGTWHERIFSEVRNDNYNHWFHAVLLTNAARYEGEKALFEGPPSDMQIAREYLDKALEICKRFPQTPQDCYTQIQYCKNIYQIH